MRHKLARALLAASIVGGAAGAVATGASAGATGGGGLTGTSWTYTYTWPTILPGTATWTFGSVHQATASTFVGHLVFWRSGTNIKIVYKYDKAIHYHCRAVYIGTITKMSMSGTMSTNGTTGCIVGTGTWTATEAVAAPVAGAQHSPANGSGAG